MRAERVFVSLLVMYSGLAATAATQQWNDFASGHQITAVGATAEANLDPAAAYDNTYTVHYFVSVTINGHSSTYGTATLVVAVESNNGSGWVERATSTYQCSYAISWPPPYAPRTCSLWPHEQKAVTVAGLLLNSDVRLKAKSFSTSNGAGGSFGIRGGDGAGSNPETYHGVTYALYPPAPSNWDIVPLNHDNQAISRCAADCFAATYAQSTVPYYSLDAHRSVTLVYHGDRVWPRPFVHLNVQKPSGTVPDTIFLQVKKAGVFQTFVNGETLLKFIAAASGWQRIGGQLQDSTLATNMYDVDVIVTWHYPSGSTTVQTWRTRLMVVNEGASSIARGWTLAGVQRSYQQADGSILLTEGDGSGVFFQKVSTGTFASPSGEFSTLAVNGAGWKRLYPDSTKVYFNSAGRVTDVYDRFNNRTQFLYDGSNRLTTIRDPNLKDLVLAYGTNGLSSIRESITPFRYTNITVQSDSTLTAIQDPDAVGTGFQYDGNRRLWKTTDRRGSTTTLGYQVVSGRTTGKLATITAPAVPLFGGGTAAPIVTYAPWQTIGIPYAPTASSPYPLVLPDTVFGRLMNPAGDTTRFTANRWGQPVLTRDPLGRITTVLYTSAGLPARVTRPTGAIDTLAYNSDGLVTYTRPAGTTATTIRYAAWAIADSSGGPGQMNVRSYVSGGKVDSTWTYDVYGLYVTKYQYDSRGRVTRVTDPSGHLRIKTNYGATNDNRLGDSLPGGRVTTYGYDLYGRQTSVTQAGAPTRYVAYDVLNRPTDVYDGVNPSPTHYAYDSLYLRSVTDLKNQVYSFTYDALGRMTLRTDPLGQSDRYGYDLVGTLRRWWNRRGDSTDYIYDKLGRLVKKLGPKTSTDSFYFAPDDRSIAAFNYSMAPTWEQRTYLDINGRPDSVRTTINGYAFVRRYGYAANGLVDSIWNSTPAGTALLNRRFGYNTSRGTLDSLRFGVGWTSFAHTPDGLRNLEFFPNAAGVKDGTGAQRAFSSVHGVTQVQVLTDSAVQSAFDLYGYDVVGRIAQQHVQSSVKGGSHYGYDGVGRLVVDSNVYALDPPTCTDNPDNGHLCPGTGWLGVDVTTFTYDLVGNRTDHGATYAPGTNRLSAFDGCAYTSDGDGNVTSRTCSGDVVTYYWSSENRLDSLQRAGYPMRRFFYDANGDLTKMTASSGTSYYLWADGNLLAELDATGQVLVEYSHRGGLDNLHARHEGGLTTYYVGDASGTPLVLKDENDYEERPGWDVWGRGGADPSCLAGEHHARPGWKGALWVGCSGDELYYMRARWYEPRTGRFMSEDPIGLEGGINPYVFAGNDPISGRDPTGLDEWCVREYPGPDPYAITYEWYRCNDPSVGLWWNQLGANEQERLANKVLYDCSGTPQNDPSICELRFPQPQDPWIRIGTPQIVSMCPNVSFLEWNLGQRLIALSMKSGVEEGFLITGATALPVGPLTLKLPTRLYSWSVPRGTVAVVHSHPLGSGLSDADIAYANRSRLRVVSVAAGNLYGSVSPGDPPMQCNL